MTPLGPVETLLKAVARVPVGGHPVRVGAAPRRNRKKYPFVGTIDFQGLKVRVENRKGSFRSGTDSDGHAWRVRMHAHYGEIANTEGADGDCLDVYVGPNADSVLVVVVHQNNPVSGEYDEDKVLIGFDSPKDAVVLYRKQYDRPGFYGSHTVLNIGQFWRWVHDRRRHGRKVEV